MIRALDILTNAGLVRSTAVAPRRAHYHLTYHTAVHEVEPGPSREGPAIYISAALMPFPISCSPPVIRSASHGTVTPACERMTLSLLSLVNVRVRTRSAAVLVVAWG